MSITPYSLFTAVLWSSAFILLLYFFRKNTRLLALTGVTPLLFLILGTALRCLFPIEFLHFTNVVGLEGLVAGLFRALRAPLGQLPLQVWEVLLLVWAAGSWAWRHAQALALGNSTKSCVPMNRWRIPA